MKATIAKRVNQGFIYYVATISEGESILWSSLGECKSWLRKELNYKLNDLKNKQWS